MANELFGRREPAVRFEFPAFVGSLFQNSALHTAQSRIGHLKRPGGRRRSEGPRKGFKKARYLILMPQRTKVGGNGNHQAFPKYLVEPGGRCSDGRLQ